MRITKRRLRRIIGEEKQRLLEMEHEVYLEPEHWDITPNAEFGNAPCPRQVATAIAQSGASDSDILNWLHVLTMELTTGAPVAAPVEDVEIDYVAEAL